MKHYIRTNWKSIAIAFVFVSLAFLYGVAAVGCSTVEGLGKDISQASAGIRDAMAKN